MEQLKKLLSFEGVPVSEFPKIPLYMDQLLSFFDEVLGIFRLSTKEPILTKTMVNNYVKARVLPAPVAKKYNRHQLMQLRIIGQLKNVLSIDDIRRLTVAGKSGEWSAPVEDVYTTFAEAEQQAIQKLRERLESSGEGMDPAERSKVALRLATEANILKQAAERMIREH